MNKNTHSNAAGDQNQTNSLGRGTKIAFLILSIVFAIGAFVPVLVNGLVSDQLDWSLYPLGAILMAWLILAPWFVLRQHRAAISWGMAVITVPVFLLLVEFLSKARGWFLPLGLPAAVLGLAGLGGITWLWCYSKFHPWYAAASTFFILGILTFSEQIVARPFLFPDPYEWIRSLVAYSLVGVAILLTMFAALVHGSRIRRIS